jgi:hypothetical protein
MKHLIHLNQCVAVNDVFYNFITLEKIAEA